MIIECLLKRPAPNYTQVEFGNALNPKTYKFEPKDKNDPKSPHVCEVSDEKHAKVLLAITPVAYIEFGTAIPEEEVNIDDGDDIYSDSILAELNTADVSNDWLQSFAKHYLKVSPKDKNKLRSLYQEQTGKELPESMTATAMIRECLIVIAAEAKDALVLAEANRKNGY